ncbi:MbcA/ParS/Xre antitoxin family protein [Flavimaribacter sediminis]|nr:MbcA/ParS/Xre antitoxin family protein [Flavimaribacter sediminis]
MTRSSIVSKAVLKAADQLGLIDEELARVLRLTPARSLVAKAIPASISAGANSDDRALLLIRIFRLLDTLSAGSAETMRQWMQNENLALGCKPRNLVVTEDGLSRVFDYLNGRVKTPVH